MTNIKKKIFDEVAEETGLPSAAVKKVFWTQVEFINEKIKSASTRPVRLKNFGLFHLRNNFIKKKLENGVNPDEIIESIIKRKEKRREEKRQKYDY